MELLKFIAKRLLNGLLVMFGVVLVIFVLFNVLPVNSARMTLGQRADTASVAAIEKEFRLNLPWYSRMAYYFNDLSPISFHNLQDEHATSFLRPEDVSYTKLFTVGTTSVVAKMPYLGRSFQRRTKVSEMIGENMFATFMLAITAMVFAAIVGIVLGVFAAVKQYTVWDNAILVMSTLGVSQPAHFAGIIIAMVFGNYLREWTGLNSSGNLDTVDLEGSVIVWKNLVLPAFALGIRPIAIITQLTRSSMLDALGQDYVRTARAKGLSFFSVVFKHALRNAMNPVITSISGWLAAVLTGAYLIEKVFAYHGLGMLTIDSLLLFDFPVVMGSVLFIAFVFVVMNIFTDILYSVLDPRVTIKG